MHIVDSHCHIDKVDLSPFNNNIKTMLSSADELFVKEFLCVSINLENFHAVLELAQQHKEIYASVGVHPTEQDGIDPDVATLIKLGSNDDIIAIGETGLDYFHLKRDEVEWQRQRFKRHIEAAKKLNKPLIIHTREAKDDTLAIMRDMDANSGVMHCFVEDYATAKAAIDLGFYISFSGIVTFKNAKTLHEVAQKIPLDCMLVETDSPYLTPEPYRGKANNPGYTYFVAKAIAKLRGISIDEVASATTANFHNLFFAKK